MCAEFVVKFFVLSVNLQTRMQPADAPESIYQYGALERQQMAHLGAKMEIL